MNKRFITIISILLIFFPQNADADRIFSHESILDLTPKEEQSAFIDEMISMSYCLLAANNIKSDMTINDFTDFMAQKYIYYTEMEMQREVDGQVTALYHFTPYLSLKVQGDPIISAEIAMTCPEHPQAHVKVPMIVSMNQYDFGDLEKYLAYYEYYPWKKDTPIDLYYQHWLDEWNIENCILQKHSVTHIPTVTLMHFLLETTTFYAGMPSEQFEEIDDTFKSAYGIHYPPNPSAIGLEGVSLAAVASQIFYKDSFWVMTLALDEKQLLHITFGVNVPKSPNLFGSAYTQGVQVDNDIVIYSYPYVEIYVDLNETWMARQLRENRDYDY